MNAAAKLGEVPLMSAVVPCRGHAAAVRACLKSLCDQRFPGPYEIIVVDSAGDPAVAAAVAAFPRARLIRSEHPLPAGPARNLGAAAATAAHLAFIDADCVAEPDWLARAHAALAAGAEAVGGPVGDIYPQESIAVADNFLQFYEMTPGRPAGGAAYLPSCNLAMRRDVLEALGGFSAISPGQDVLLTQRVAARGPDRLRFDPSVRVRHEGRRTLAALWRHHRAFGRARGEHGLMSRPIDARLARHWPYVAPLILKRLAYMTARVAVWSPRRLPRFLLLQPLIVAGVVSWAIGVVDGTRRRDSGPDPESPFPTRRVGGGDLQTESNR